MLEYKKTNKPYMPHLTAYYPCNPTGTRPNQTIFAKKSVARWANSEGTASGCSDSHKVEENKKTGSGGLWAG